MPFKQTFVIALIISALLTLFSSCRDRGAYTYSGVLLDSCLANPVVDAEIFVNAGMSGDQKVYTDQNGYFKATGGWNDKATFLHKEVIPGITVYSKEGVRLLEFDYLPEGNHDLGTISVQNHLRIPYRLDTTNYSCFNCISNYRVSQPYWVYNNPYLIKDFYVDEATPITGTIHYTISLRVDPASQKPYYPVMLQVSTIDSTYPDQDITDLLAFCGLSDTVVIKL